MENARARLDFPTGLRLSGIAGFVILSLLTFLLSGRVQGAPIVQLGILFSFVFLGTGILAARPDFEVLGWVVLGTELLMVITLVGFGPLWAVLTALGVVCLADFDHSVAIMYALGGMVDVSHEAARRRLLSRRLATIGFTALISLTVSILGVSLAPPLLLSGNPGAVVGALAVAVVLLIAFVTSFYGGGRRFEDVSLPRSK